MTAAGCPPGSTPKSRLSEALRVLIASDAIAGLDSMAVGHVLGEAFAQQGAQVAVYPMATGGEALGRVLRTLDGHAQVALPLTLGEFAAGLDVAIRTLRDDADATYYLDLTQLSEISVDAVIEGIGPDDLAGLSHNDERLVAVVPDGDASLPLTGMPGLIATRGRRDGADLGATLAADARATAWLERIRTQDQPGAGAVGGLGAVIQALGGVVLDGVGACARAGNLAGVIAKADVVVTGAEQLDFHAVGGPVVREVSGLAGSALRPVIAVVGRSFVSARELRLAGIETAYPILKGPGDTGPTAEQLRATAAKVAATWRW